MYNSFNTDFADVSIFKIFSLNRILSSKYFTFKKVKSETPEVVISDTKKLKESHERVKNGSLVKGERLDTIPWREITVLPGTGQNAYSTSKK